jgi:hypothetical protein
MAYKTIRTYTRPNVYVPFFIFNEEIRNYTDQTYNQTGKRISVNTTVSENELQQITTSVWADESAFNEFLADPVIIRHTDLVRDYNKSFEITLTWDNSEA